MTKKKTNATRKLKRGRPKGSKSKPKKIKKTKMSKNKANTTPPSHKPGGGFAKGNKCGKGNPYAKRTAQLRKVFYDAITEEDMFEVARSLIAKAKTGDVMAIKELLLRLLGQPLEYVEDKIDDQEDWVFRTTLSNGDYLVVPAGTNPIAAYHAHIRSKKS